MAKEELKAYNPDDIITELVKLLREIGVIMGRIPNRDPTDARHSALSAMQTTLVPLIFSNQCVTVTAQVTDIKQLASFFNISIEQLTYLQDNHIKVNLLVFFHFKIENLFSNIVDAIVNPYRGRGFENIVNDLCNSITIDDKEKKKETLKALSSLRNSLHNNGIHQNANFETEVDGIKFEFIKGEIPKCETFNLIKLLQLILKIVDEIINSPEVLGLPIPIKDLRNSLLEPLTPDDFINANKPTD